MFPTGSRLLLGATTIATVTATIYASTVWGALGTTGLIFLSVALAVVTGINLYVRDSDVSANDPAAATDSAAAHLAPAASIWPLAGALGGVLVVLGLITYPVVFVFGIITLLAATVEWMIEAWSQRASASRAFNTGVRERTANPAEFPVLAALVVGIVVYSFSRIMLFLTQSGGPVAFAVLAAFVLAIGFLVAYRPQLKGSAVMGVAAIAVLGLVAGGVAAALAGERELEPHETTTALAEEGDCDTPDETDADEHASQSLGDKANLHGEVILRSDGELVAHTVGIEGDQEQLTIVRANPTNIQFRNESAEERRLVLDLGVEQAVDEETGDTIPGEAEPIQICTALVDEDGTTLLTFEIGASSPPDEPYRFFVPGVDGQEILVVVP